MAKQHPLKVGDLVRLGPKRADHKGILDTLTWPQRIIKVEIDEEEYTSKTLVYIQDRPYSGFFAYRFVLVNPCLPERFVLEVEAPE